MTNEQDDTLLPTQLATSNDRVDTDSETDSDSEHEEERFFFMYGIKVCFVDIY